MTKLIGYLRVSTAEKNPEHQTDALVHAGIGPVSNRLNHASDAKACRRELDKARVRATRTGEHLQVSRCTPLGHLTKRDIERSGGEPAYEARLPVLI